MSIGQGHAPAITLPPSILVKQITLLSIIAAEARHWMQALDFLSSRKKVYPFEKMLSNTFDLAGTSYTIGGIPVYLIFLASAALVGLWSIRGFKK